MNYLETLGECVGVEHVGELGEGVGLRRIVRPGRFDQINSRESQVKHGDVRRTWSCG
jgi:hypothetical protein